MNRRLALKVVIYYIKYGSHSEYLYSLLQYLSNVYFESKYKMAAIQGSFSIYIKKYTFTNHVRIGTVTGPCGFVLPDQDHAQGFVPLTLSS